ncbi:MAG: aminotransferase class IV [Bacteroidales bacterium]|nr:aminotransferase class IV [Bacteroidales bacterium]
MNEITGDFFSLNGKITPLTNFTTEYLTQEDSIYEVLRIVKGFPLFFEDHLQRLQNSFKIIHQKNPVSSNKLLKAINDLNNENNIREGAVKIIFLSNDNIPGLMVYNIKPYTPSIGELEKGIEVVSVQRERKNPNAKIWSWHTRKSTMKLINDQNAFEGILVNKEGFVTEGSRSNIFFIKNNTIITPPDEDILPGITRKNVIKLCHNATIDLKIERIKYKDISIYEAAFMTGTTRKIVAVRIIDDILLNPNHPMIALICTKFDQLVSRYIKTKQTTEFSRANTSNFLSL